MLLILATSPTVFFKKLFFKHENTLLWSTRFYLNMQYASSNMANIHGVENIAD